mgnify:CR=1 FL=1
MHPRTRRIHRLALALLCAGLGLALWTAPGRSQSGPAPEALLWTEDFAGGIPATWTVRDLAGTGVLWTDLAGAGLADNYTGGLGDAAAASSDAAGITPFDTALETPPFTLPHALTATLTYRANYQAMIHHDHLDLELSPDDGATWTPLLSWNEDHGGYRSLPGETVAVDLSPYLGQAGLRLRWRYYDPRDNAWDHYVQLDDVALRVQGHDLRLARHGPPPLADPAGSLTQTLVYTNAGAPYATDLRFEIAPAACLTAVRLAASRGPVTPTAGTVWQVPPLPAGASGVLTVSAAVQSGTPGAQTFTSTATLYPPAEATLADNVAPLPLRVRNVPPVAHADRVTTTEEAPVAVAVLANDADANGDGLTLAAVAPPLHGSATLSGGQVVYQPARDYAGAETFTYTVADPGGLTASGRVTATVLPVNDAPVVTPPPDQMLHPGQRATVSFTVTDVDSAAAALQVTATVTNPTVLPPGHLALAQSGTQCTLTLTATATLGESAVRLTASDGLRRSQARFRVQVARATVYLPVLFRAYDPRPDLLIAALAADPAAPTALTVAVRNAGAAPARAFWVDLYLDPEAPPEVNQPWPVLSTPYGAAWFVDTLAAGETLTLTVGGPHYQAAQSRWPSAYPPGAHAVWAYADSWGYPQPWAGVVEADEGNNRYGPVTFTAPSTLFYTPAERTCGPLPPRPRYPQGGEP